MTTVVTPLDLKSCPRVSAREARASRRALAIIASLPASWQLELSPLGAASLEVVAVGPRPGAHADGVAFALARGASAGRATLDSLFAARLLDAALGAQRPFTAARALGPAERAVLAGVLAPAFDRVGWSLGLAHAAAPVDGASVVVLRLQTAFGAGDVVVELDGGAVDPAGWRARAAALAVVARIDVAATTLTAGALAAVEPGDAIVFDGVAFAALAVDVGWRGDIAIGVHVAPAVIAPDGRVELTAGFHMNAAAARTRMATNVTEGSMSTSDAGANAAAALAAAPIEVIAELGRLSLRGDEVLGLAPGAVLTLAVDRRRAISLRVGDEAWAEGELVDVDGVLGVRVTRLVRPPDGR